MEILIQNIIPVTGVVAFLLGALAARYKKVFTVVLLLALPLAYLAARFLPQFFMIRKASDTKGWLTFYTQIYETADDPMKTAIHIAPVLFIIGLFLTRFYYKHIHQEKVETLVERKARVRAYYGVGKYE